MGMDENECTIDAANIYNLLFLPQQGANFLNPNYVQPTTPAGAWSVEIQYGTTTVEPGSTDTIINLTDAGQFATAKYVEIRVNNAKEFRKILTLVGTVLTLETALSDVPDEPGQVIGWSQFTWSLIGRSVTIEEGYGERGGAGFSLDNDGNMPFIPPVESKVRLRNYPDMSYVYFAGYIKNPNANFVRQYDNLTEKQRLDVECYDLYRELERQIISGKVYTGQKAGAILKDLVRNYSTLDASAIDGTAGPTFARYAVTNSFVSQEIERIMSLTGWVFWIDPATEKVYAGDPSNNTQQLLSITDMNIQQMFLRNQIQLSPNYSGIKTRVVMNWTLKYQTGTCNVANGSGIVLGYSGTLWDNIPVTDLKFQVDAVIHSYCVTYSHLLAYCCVIRYLDTPHIELQLPDLGCCPVEGMIEGQIVFDPGVVIPISL